MYFVVPFSFPYSKGGGLRRSMCSMKQNLNQKVQSKNVFNLLDPEMTAKQQIRLYTHMLSVNTVEDLLLCLHIVSLVELPGLYQGCWVESLLKKPGQMQQTSLKHFTTLFSKMAVQIGSYGSGRVPKYQEMLQKHKIRKQD